MAPSTSSKKDLGVVTSLVLAERTGIFLLPRGFPLCTHVAPFPDRGFWEFLHFLYLFLIQFCFIFVLFIFLNPHRPPEILFFFCIYVFILFSVYFISFLLFYCSNPTFYNVSFEPNETFGEKKTSSYLLPISKATEDE